MRDQPSHASSVYTPKYPATGKCLALRNGRSVTALRERTTRAQFFGYGGRADANEAAHRMAGRVATVRELTGYDADEKVEMGIGKRR